MGQKLDDPPDGPDTDICDSCCEPLGENAFEVELPGRDLVGSPIWVCSKDCAAEYVSGWAESMYEAHEDAKLWN